MNSLTCDCTNSNQWHLELLEGCDDIVDRLTHVVDVLQPRHSIHNSNSFRLRLVLETDETTAPRYAAVGAGARICDVLG
mgnify:CR=1 FL=1